MKLLAIATFAILFLSSFAHAEDECQIILSDRMASSIHDLAKLRIDLDSQLAKGESTAIAFALFKAFENKKKEILLYSKDSGLTESLLEQNLKSEIEKQQRGRDSITQSLVDLENEQIDAINIQKDLEVSLQRKDRDGEFYQKISDNQFLVVGGGKNGRGLKTIELYDSERRTLTEIAQMKIERYAKVLPLTDQKFLIWGEHSVSRVPAEIFDLKTKESTLLGFHLPIVDYSGWLMKSGKVLQLHRDGFYSFDLNTRERESFGVPKSSAVDRAKSQLSEGSLILSGGRYRTDEGFVQLDSILKIDGTTLEVSQIGTLTVARNSHAQIELRDGTILICGGRAGLGERQGYAEVERFDPSTGKTMLIGHMLQPRYDHQLVLLPDNRVVILGGNIEVKDSPGVTDALSSIEVFDLDTNKASYLGEMKASGDDFKAFLSGKNGVVVFGNLGDRAIELIKVGPKQ